MSNDPEPPDWVAVYAENLEQSYAFQRDTFAIRLFTEARQQALLWTLRSYGHECFESTEGIMRRAATFHAFLTADHPLNQGQA